MSRILIAFLASGILLGCQSSGGVTDADQKANEAKYGQAGYEDAMHKAGRDKELAQQKKIDEERKQGDR